jgi:hypothetical protein
MIITSWNCRGMGRKKKEEALKDIIKTSKASILLLQGDQNEPTRCAQILVECLERKPRSCWKCQGHLREGFAQCGMPPK